MTTADLALPIRDRYNAFIERHEVAWELTMGALALVWVALGFAADQFPPGLAPGVDALELILTGVFVAEFTTRIWAAHDRRQYLKAHFIDAVALIPQVRGFRLLRLLRLLRLVRAFAGFYRAAMHASRLAQHRGLAWILVSWLTVMVICSAFFYAAENGINKLVNSPFDALWWGITTITTVGYGDTTPVTTDGKIAAMVLMVLGIGLFSIVTATIASYYLSQDTAHGGEDALVERLRVLAELRADGALTEEEFTAAKSLVLHGATAE